MMIIIIALKGMLLAFITIYKWVAGFLQDTITCSSPRGVLHLHRFPSLLHILMIWVNK